MGDGQGIRYKSVRDWVMRVDEQAGGHRLPWLVSLELTERCNLRCVHCYINRPAGDEEARQKEMSLDRWQGILDQVAEAGTLWLLVTGGEPLLRPDFPEFYLYARRKGLHVFVFTNGTLLTPELADLLAEYPPWHTEITLYGATAETYERITGVPGSYARCRRGIDLLLERGLVLYLKTMILTLNVHELPVMQRLADDLGVRFRWDAVVNSRLDGDHRPLAYRLSPEEIVALDQQDPKRVEQWQEICGRSWPSLDEEKLFTCGAGWGAFHLDPYGGLYPCPVARWLRYDLLQGSLGEALSEFLPAVRALPRTSDSACRKCDLRILCQNCPAKAYVETGDPEALDPFLCQLVHLRQQDLGLTVTLATEKQEMRT